MVSKAIDELSDGYSSPDPLVDTLSPFKSPVVSKYRQSLKKSTPAIKSKLQLDLKEPHPSQHRADVGHSVTFASPGKANESPWKIKVTVQAENPGALNVLNGSPPKKITRSRTISVPLGITNDITPTRGRGRPKKSPAKPKPSPRNSKVEHEHSVKQVAFTQNDLIETTSEHIVEHANITESRGSSFGPATASDTESNDASNIATPRKNLSDQPKVQLPSFNFTKLTPLHMKYGPIPSPLLGPPKPSNSKMKSVKGRKCTPIKLVNSEDSGCSPESPTALYTEHVDQYGTSAAGPAETIHISPTNRDDFDFNPTDFEPCKLSKGSEYTTRNTDDFTSSQTNSVYMKKKRVYSPIRKDKASVAASNLSPIQYSSPMYPQGKILTPDGGENEGADHLLGIGRIIAGFRLDAPEECLSPSHIHPSSYTSRRESAASHALRSNPIQGARYNYAGHTSYSFSRLRGTTKINDQNINVQQDDVTKNNDYSSASLPDENPPLITESVSALTGNLAELDDDKHKDVSTKNSAKESSHFQELLDVSEGSQQVVGRLQHSGLLTPERQTSADSAIFTDTIGSELKENGVGLNSNFRSYLATPSYSSDRSASREDLDGGMFPQEEEYSTDVEDSSVGSHTEAYQDDNTNMEVERQLHAEMLSREETTSFHPSIVEIENDCEKNDAIDLVCVRGVEEEPTKLCSSSYPTVPYFTNSEMSCSVNLIDFDEGYIGVPQGSGISGSSSMFSGPDTDSKDEMRPASLISSIIKSQANPISPMSRSTQTSDKYSGDEYDSGFQTDADAEGPQDHARSEVSSSHLPSECPELNHRPGLYPLSGNGANANKSHKAILDIPATKNEQLRDSLSEDEQILKEFPSSTVFQPHLPPGKAFNHQNINPTHHQNTNLTQHQHNVNLTAFPGQNWEHHATPSTFSDNNRPEGGQHLSALKPWTKTHYKALDRMYQVFKSNPFEFSVDNPANHTIAAFFELEVGKTLSNWGYPVTFELEHMVLASRFFGLLEFGSVQEETARDATSHNHELISEWEVCVRLFSIIAGEDVRRDEKRGIAIRRSGNETLG